MLIAIIAKTCVATLIMRDAHEVDHQAEEVTVAESCSKCFIIGARNLAKYIGKWCIKCHILI